MWEMPCWRGRELGELHRPSLPRPGAGESVVVGSECWETCRGGADILHFPAANKEGGEGAAITLQRW